MRGLLLTSASFFATSALLAASPQATPPPAQIITVSPGCPIGFTARRQSPTEVVAIDRDTRHRSGQGVHLSLLHPHTDIRSAEVTVHAASNKTRYLPLQASDTQPDLSKNFHLSVAGVGGLSTSDLWLDDAASILSVDLLSVTYADGSTWQRNNRSSCHADISGFMLVDGQAQSSTP